MRVEFSAIVEVPDDVKLSDIEDWLRFELGATGQLSGDNALVHTDLVTVEHDGTTQDKLRAWMEASVRAAAKVGEKK